MEKPLIAIVSVPSDRRPPDGSHCIPTASKCSYDLAVNFSHHSAILCKTGAGGRVARTFRRNSISPVTLGAPLVTSSRARYSACMGMSVVSAATSALRVSRSSGRAVEDDELEALGDGLERVAAAVLAEVEGDELDVGAQQIPVRRDDAEVVELGGREGAVCGESESTDLLYGRRNCVHLCVHRRTCSSEIHIGISGLHRSKTFCIESRRCKSARILNWIAISESRRPEFRVP